MKWTVRGQGGEHQVEVNRTPEGFEVVLDGVRRVVDVTCVSQSRASMRDLETAASYELAFQRLPRRGYRLCLAEREFLFDVLTPIEALELAASQRSGLGGQLEAPIPGRVVKVPVSVGDEVDQGQTLVVLEAMKMENELEADGAVRVVAVHVEPGQAVEAGTVLVELEAL